VKNAALGYVNGNGGIMSEQASLILSAGHERVLQTASEAIANQPPVWEAAKRHELTIQRCGACREFIYYPRPRCPMFFRINFHGSALVDGQSVQLHRGAGEPRAACLPTRRTCWRIVELAEGRAMTTNVVARPSRFESRCRSRSSSTT